MGIFMEAVYMVPFTKTILVEIWFFLAACLLARLAGGLAFIAVCGGPLIRRRWTCLHLAFTTYHLPFSIYDLPFTTAVSGDPLIRRLWTCFHLPFTTYHLLFTIYHTYHKQTLDIRWGWSRRWTCLHLPETGSCMMYICHVLCTIFLIRRLLPYNHTFTL